MPARHSGQYRYSGPSGRADLDPSGDNFLRLGVVFFVALATSGVYLTAFVDLVRLGGADVLVVGVRAADAVAIRRGATNIAPHK